MAEIDYSALTARVVEILATDGRLDGVYVTDELSEPTTEQTPAIIVALDDEAREPFQIVGGMAAGQPDKVVVGFAVSCWTFNAQSIAATNRERNDLARKVVNVLRDNIQPRIGPNPTDYIFVRRIKFGTPQNEQTKSLYGCALLTVEVHARA